MGLYVSAPRKRKRDNIYDEKYEARRRKAHDEAERSRREAIRSRRGFGQTILTGRSDLDTPEIRRGGEGDGDEDVVRSAPGATAKKKRRTILAGGMV